MFHAIEFFVTDYICSDYPGFENKSLLYQLLLKVFDTAIDRDTHDLEMLLSIAHKAEEGYNQGDY